MKSVSSFLSSGNAIPIHFSEDVSIALRVKNTPRTRTQPKRFIIAHNAPKRHPHSKDTILSSPCTPQEIFENIIGFLHEKSVGAFSQVNTGFYSLISHNKPIQKL